MIIMGRLKNEMLVFTNVQFNSENFID